MTLVNFDQQISVSFLSHMQECVCEIVPYTQLLPWIFRPHRPPDWRSSCTVDLYNAWHMVCSGMLWYGMVWSGAQSFGCSLVSHFTRGVPCFTLPLPANVKFHQNLANFASTCSIIHKLQFCWTCQILGYEKVFLLQIFFSSSLMMRFKIKMTISSSIIVGGKSDIGFVCALN